MAAAFTALTGPRGLVAIRLAKTLQQGVEEHDVSSRSAYTWGKDEGEDNAHLLAGIPCNLLLQDLKSNRHDFYEIRFSRNPDK